MPSSRKSGRTLTAGDLVIDGGNSHFTDTNRRARALAVNQVMFMGLGVSGGEAGARYGPSLMPGGPRQAYDRVGPVLEAAAAQVDGEPCVAHLGPGSAGHYVKMVHNGIEYGLMELIAETYDLLKRGLGMQPEELHEVYAAWNQGELSSFLLEITARIFLKKDEKTGKPLIDLILDRAKQKGTGMWTSWEAMDLQVGTPTIDIAVVMRDLSGYQAERLAAAQVLTSPNHVFGGDRARFLDKLKNGLYAGMIATYAQGLALLKKASDTYTYGLDLETVARIWRGGCIIRAALLEDIRAAFQTRPDLNHLLLDPKLGRRVYGPAAGPPGRGRGRRRAGGAGPGVNAVPGLFRRLSQRPTAGQPDSGPTGLLRGPYLRTGGRRRRLSHPMGRGLRQVLKGEPRFALRTTKAGRAGVPPAT